MWSGAPPTVKRRASFNPPRFFFLVLHPVQLKSMKSEEYRLLMRNLELHYQDYMRDSQDSQLFAPDDRMQIEEDYTKSTQHFDSLLRSMEKGISKLKSFL